MPEWMLIVIAIAGIFLIGLFFSAIDLIKDFAKVVFISLFVFLLILLANRTLAPNEPEPYFGQNNYPPDSEFVEPDGLNNYPPDSEFIEPNGSEIEPSAGNGSNAGISDYLRNLTEDIDEFVFGPGNQYGQQPSDADGNGVDANRASGQNDLIYIFPEDVPEQNRIADQPVNQAPSRSTRTQSGSGATNSGAVPAMW